jgi:outer membrane protein OmpA-like peptidoglycan-associated protein
MDSATSTQAGDTAGRAGAAGLSGDASAQVPSGREALAATDVDSSGAGGGGAGRSDAGQTDSSLSGTQGDTLGSGSTAASATDEAGARADASAATDDAARGAAAQTSEGSGGGTAAGASGDTAAGTGGANLDQAAAATAAPSTSGASDGGDTLSREQAAQQDRGSAKSDEVIIGMVEAPGRKATPTETVIPQTLGGMLPLTLGVEGEGEFDFDKSVLREQVRVVLDELAGKLKTADYDRLEIVGHTDRIGTEDYNQYLSERRAWAVARYLIEQGVPANKVRVEGRGMHEPVTTSRACEGLQRQEAIACLQKDRRVVISASIRRVDVNVH